MRAETATPPRPAQVGLPGHLGRLLWHGDQLGGPAQATCPSGHPDLDRELPGGGWPQGHLTELLLDGQGQGELRLLTPTLSALGARHQELVWIHPPHRPGMAALEALGLPWQKLLWIRTDHEDDAAWAADQALRSPGCGAVLWWTPEAGPDSPHLGTTLRRLHLAAQSRSACLWVLRPTLRRTQSSAAPLRLTLGSVPGHPGQVDIEVFKRRGPPMARPLRIDTRSHLPPALTHRLQQALAPHPAHLPSVRTPSPIGTPVPAQAADPRTAWSQWLQHTRTAALATDTPPPLRAP